MKRLLDFFFDKWLRPLLYFGVTCLLLIVSEYANQALLSRVSLILFASSLAGLFMSGLYQLFHRRWLKALISGFLLGASLVAIAFYMVFNFFVETVDGDKWANNLKIPTNIKLDEPIDLSYSNQRPDSILACIKQETDFQLYQSFQPGLYEYDFWTPKIERGNIYLKAYEITQEYALSTDALAENSMVYVENPSDSIMRFGTKTHFTIYEGDWGKPYAARFEVWLKPASGGQERKLFTKNYIIEGWQR